MCNWGRFWVEPGNALRLGLTGEADLQLLIAKLRNGIAAAQIPLGSRFAPGTPPSDESSWQALGLRLCF